MNDDAPGPDPSRRRRRRWLRRGAIDLGDFMVQIIAVVIGILLALFINHWNTERQQEAAVDTAIHAIDAELSANRLALHHSATYLYQGIARMLDDPENQGAPARPCYLWKQWSGTGAVNLTDAAYRTTMGTQALSHMAFPQAQRIAQAYGVQDIVKKSFGLIRSNILIAGPQTLDVCISAIRSFVANEHHLDDAYAAVIGPDATPWPVAPRKPALPSHPSK